MSELGQDDLKETQLRLTKNVEMFREFPPLYTGGTFVVLKDETHALGLKDGKITVFNIHTSQVVTTIAKVSIRYV